MIAAALVTLLLTPWRGPSLPTASYAAARYKLVARGIPGGRVDLSAGGVPQGWIVSFCTATMCSPLQFSMPLDARGRGWVEVALIRLEPNAPKHIHVRIAAPGAIPILVNVAR